MPSPHVFNNANMYVNPHGRRQLDIYFEPGAFDVVFARGKVAHQHEGNKRFRNLVKMHQEAYANAPTKYRKSQIVSHITNTVRQASPQGGFVKLIKGCYYEVGDRAAKEKIGQTFRDLLHTKYTSSTKAKAHARIQKRVQEYRSYTDSPTNDSQSHVPQQQKQQSEEADDSKSSVSIVSHDSMPVIHEEAAAVMPSHIDIPFGVTAATHPGRVLRLDSSSHVLDFPSTSFPAQSAASDFEPLSLEETFVAPMEFNDDPLSLKDTFVSPMEFNDNLTKFLMEFHMW